MAILYPTRRSTTSSTSSAPMADDTAWRPAEKLQALVLAETMLSIRGRRWLFDQVNLPDIADSFPTDRLLDASFVLKHVGELVLLPVVECLIKLIEPHGLSVEENDRTFLTCDTIMNILLKRGQVQVPLDDATLINLLRALAYWAGKTDSHSIHAMASSICALIFYYTSESAPENHPNFSSRCLDMLIQLIARSLATSQQVCGLELTDNVVDIIYHVFDTNQDGNLTSDEFIIVLYQREKDIA